MLKVQGSHWVYDDLVNDLEMNEAPDMRIKQNGTPKKSKTSLNQFQQKLILRQFFSHKKILQVQKNLIAVCK